MPPSLGDIWNRGKQTVSSFLGGGNSQSGDEGAHDSTSNTRPDPAGENPDFVEIDDPNTKKRRAATHVQVPKKRVDTRTDHERRLQGDYRVPAGATPIPIPGSPDGAGEARGIGAGSMSRKVGGGGHKPRNTLGNSSFQASGCVNGGAYTKYADPKRSQALSSSLNYHQPSSRTAQGDGFSSREMGGLPAQKRRKLAQSGHTDLSSDPITVDDGDEDPPMTSKVTAVNGRPRTDGHNDRTQRHVGSESRTAPFQNNEPHSLDKVLRSNNHKPRKKMANGYTSSQTSSRTSPVPKTNGHLLKTGKTAEDAVPLDDETSQELSQKHARPPSSSASTGLPDVKDLMNGVNDIKHTKQRRESENSLEFTYAYEKKPMPPPRPHHNGKHPEQQQHPPPRQRRAITQADRQPDTPRPRSEHQTRRSHETIQYAPVDERMDKKFVRDDLTSQRPAPGTTRRREKMKADSGQAESEAHPLDDSVSSIDELNGPKTIGSVSPEKKQPQANSPPAQVNGSRSSRSGSPPNWKPTQFTSGEQPGSSRRRGRLAVRPTNQDNDDELQVPLRAFCSTSAYMIDGNIAMRYDPRSNDLTIEKDRMAVPVPGGKCAVHVSSIEAARVIYDAESVTVYLKGSSGAVSNGNICISFQDMEGKNWFLNRLQRVCSVSPKWIEQPTEDMRKVFLYQVKNLEEAHEKRMGLVAREQALSDRVEAKKTRKSSEEVEAIKYENEEPERSSRRKNMLGRDIKDDRDAQARASLPKSLERSRFFDDATPRRSTRQTKAAKEKSPTPPPPIERWTKVNKPERWPHSIVYPDTGLRRVTVDFQDLERLDEGEFLNDNLISFALRQIEMKMAPEHKERVHFFNSFFYTALTTKNGRKAFNYDAVKRWTKSQDLLGCDYVVVPINIDLHWFVVIICNLPNLSRRPKGSEDDMEEQKKGEGETAEGVQEFQSDTVEPPERADGDQSAGESAENTKGMHKLSISDGEGTSKTLQPDDEAAGPADPPQPDLNDDAEAESIVKKPATEGGRKGRKRGPPSYDPDKPAIITLDSFAAPHTGEVRNLKAYLQAEAEAKRGMELDIGQLQGLNVKDDGVPTQKNFCDCGVYLVGYVEEFAKDPRAFATKALTRKLGHHHEFDDFDPSSKRDEIREDLLQLQREQAAEHKAKKAGKKAAAVKTDDQVAVSASATPKPESKTVSKAASPEEGSDRPDVRPPVQKQRRQVTSWKPTEAPGPPAQSQETADRDLEFDVPRALGSSPQHAGRQSSSAQAPQDADEPEEMLDEPNRDTTADEWDGFPNVEPNHLLDDLEAYSQDAHLDVDAQLQEAAAVGEDASTRDGRSRNAQRHEAIVEDMKSASEDQGDEVDEGPEMIEGKEVIDLGDSRDDIGRRTEIPDSQEQQQARLRRNASVQWAGTRTTFD